MSGKYYCTEHGVLFMDYNAYMTHIWEIHQGVPQDEVNRKVIEIWR